MSSKRCQTLDGRNHAIFIAEVLARVTLRFKSLAFAGGHILPQNQEIACHQPCAVTGRIVRLVFVDVTCVPRGTVEWPVRTDGIRSMQAIRHW